MAVNRYVQAKALFLAAVARPAEERRAYVQRAASGDPALALEVLALLERHDAAGLNPLDAPPSFEGVLDALDPAPERIGHWEVLGRLGRGSMGVVYHARRDDGTEAALKVLPALHRHPQLLSRLRREGAALARIDHPGIARLIEAGSFTTRTGQQPFLAMERVVGTHLRDHVASRAPALGERLELFARICDAVAAAHRAGVVHRDLKPENVLVAADGRPCVLDFGIARLVEAESHATSTMSILTRSGLLMGTLCYMSPEQAIGADCVDGRSDVYALGVLGYELVSGTLPYAVPASIAQALHAVVHHAPRPLGVLDPAWAGALERVFDRALRKRPADRYRTAEELAADVRRAAAGRPVHARAPAPWRAALAAMRARMHRITR
jgi:serine/threonine-protein kinase